MRSVGWERLPEGTFSAQRFGSILSEVKQNAGQRIEGFRNSNHPIRPMPRVIFDYVHDPSMNAFAMPYADRLIIGVNAGVPPLIYLAMFSLLSRPDVLEEIGDPKKEVVTSHPIPFMPDFGVMISRMSPLNVTMSSYMPKDRARELTARALASLMIDFIIAHEFRHLQAGHVGFLAKTTDCNFIQELNSQGESAESAMTSQALEMDADSYGITTILRFAFNVVENPDQFSAGWGIAFPNRERAAFLCMLAAWMVFKLLGMLGSSSSVWTDSTHPPPLLRLQMAQATAYECFKKRGQQELLGRLNLVTHRLVEVGEKQFSLLTERPPDLQGVLRVAGEEGKRHVSEILKTWSLIEKSLSQFSYVSFQSLQQDRADNERLGV
jgi:hypothetical protein